MPDPYRVPLRCLIVDDNSLFLEGAADLLRREGLEVVGVASNGAEAIGLVTELQPDVTLVDIDLGDEDGFELTQRLNDISSASSKVILVSTHAEEDVAPPDRCEPCGRIRLEDAALGAGDPRRARTRCLDRLPAALEKHHDREHAPVVVFRLRQAELGQDVPHVLLDRSLGEPELAGDSGVRPTLGH
jgi:CheY-like chemotaxis protein